MFVITLIFTHSNPQWPSMMDRKDFSSNALYPITFLTSSKYQTSLEGICETGGEVTVWHSERA